MNALVQTLVEWDRATFLAINHGTKCALLDFLMPHLTHLGLGQVQALAVLMVAVGMAIRAGEVHGWRDIVRAVVARRRWVMPLMVCFVVSGLGSDAIKAVYARDRPWWFYAKEHRAGRHLEAQVLTIKGVYAIKVRGFPSGHTATSFAMAMVVTLLFRRRRTRLLVAGAWLIAVVVAFSRIYLASHWPLDVIGGAAFGIASGYVSVWACRQWAKSYAKAKTA